MRVVDAIALQGVQVIKTTRGAGMAKNETAGPTQQASGNSERQARQAAALRENLRKRKAQQRQRTAAAGPGHIAEAPHEPRDAIPATSANSTAKPRHGT